MGFGQFIQGEVRISQAAFASKILSQAVLLCFGKCDTPFRFQLEEVCQSCGLHLQRALLCSTTAYLGENQFAVLVLSEYPLQAGSGAGH